MKAISTRYLKDDVLAGLVVFLVALPLCLGIALASNAPIISGLISGIIAGLLVSQISGSSLSVSGPAAGLTVIVATAISDLGSFELFLVAVFVSGAIQVVLGLIRAGSLSAFFPNSVIRGMLAAIGITIILKQIPHGLGRDSDYEGDLDFWNITDHENTFSELVLAVNSVSPVAVTICIMGIMTLVFWPLLQKKLSWLEFFPAALIAVVVGIVLNQLAGVVVPGMKLTSEHLVSVPDIHLGFFIEKFQLPTWETLSNPSVWMVGLTIAIVGSIETLLCLEATDKLDPEGRVSNTNKELLAQGTGNILCGLLGGLPMTSVIVRSSANVYSGGKTRKACFFHGLFLLVCVLMLTPILNLIPLSALAAILVVVGFKLTSPAIVRRVYSSGVEHFIPFAVTILAVIFTDLLKGVFVGLAVAFVILIKTSVYGAIVAVREGSTYFIQFTKDVTFSNKAHLRKILNQIPDDSTVYIDGTKAMFINQDISEMLSEFRTRGHSKNITVELIEVRGKDFSLIGRKNNRINEKLSTKTIAVQ